MKETKNTLLEQNELTEKELDVITTVFRSYETGLREATIHPKVGKLYLNFHRLLILVSLKYCNNLSTGGSSLVIGSNNNNLNKPLNLTELDLELDNENI